jgi:hypothetical protein
MSTHTHTHTHEYYCVTNVLSLPVGLFITLTKPAQTNAQVRGRIAEESDKQYSSVKIRTLYIGCL